jgi:hypothetical protein
MVLTCDAATWTELSSDELAIAEACSPSFQEMDVTISNTGWLSCSHGTGRISVWLPVERRDSYRALARRGRRVVVGAQSGAVTILQLPDTQR